MPGIEGELGILPHHTPLVTALGTGELGSGRPEPSSSCSSAAASSRSDPDKVVVMAFVAEHSDEIDAAAAAAARKAAEADLEAVHDPVDLARVRAALQTALMRSGSRLDGASEADLRWT